MQRGREGLASLGRGNSLPANEMEVRGGKGAGLPASSNVLGAERTNMEDYTYILCPACGGEAVPCGSLDCSWLRCQGCGLHFSVRPTGPGEYLDHVPVKERRAGRPAHPTGGERRGGPVPPHQPSPSAKDNELEAQ